MPTRKRFSETWLRTLLDRPPAADTTYGEPGRVGFLLRHRTGGALVWLARYQRDGKPVWLTLGEYPAMTLEQAHEAHGEVRRQLAGGLDPKTERERQRIERARQEERRKAVDAVTVRNVIAEWAWHHARRKRKRPREAVRLLKAHLLAAPVKDKPASAVTKRDLVIIVDKVLARGSPVMANRLRDLIAQVFSFAAARDLIPASPAAGLLKNPGGDEQAKERNLSRDEIRAFWNGVEDAAISKPVRLALKLILVTAQRPGEVAGATWSEIDERRALWTTPAERAKNGRAHEVPLSPLALELLRELYAATEPRATKKRPVPLPRSPFLLPAAHVELKAGEPLSVRALSRALRNNIDAETKKLFGCDAFTPHDLRRTAASHMTALGIARLHVSKLLNHSDQGVTGKVYDQHDYAPEKKLALETWADHLRAVIAANPAKVVPICGRK